MYSSSKRILEILLLISSESHTSKEISEKFPSVSIKTIKNDIKRLKKFGFVIYDEKTKKNLLNYDLFSKKKDNGRDKV